MKKKHFYSHLIQITDITIELGDLDLTQQERLHLLSLLDANIHSTVIKTILSELSEEDKKVFLKNLTLNNHEIIWIHLKEKIQNSEEKIKSAIDEISKELLKDVLKVKRKV